MSSFNWREVPLFLWVVIVFALAIPLLVNSSSNDFYVKQPSGVAAKAKVNNPPTSVFPAPSYVDNIIKPTPTPPPPTTSPPGSIYNCKYILGNSESGYSNCSGCRGAYLEGDMPTCMAP